MVFHRSPTAGPARDAMHSAEIANYSEILEWTPYWSHGDVMTPSRFETWLNFINNETLEYLVSRLENITKTKPWISAEYEYNASAYWISNLTVQVNFGSAIVASNQSMTISFPWKVNSDAMRSARWITTGYEISRYPPYTETYGDAFMVHMMLKYGDLVGSRIYQYVVLNATHHVLHVTTANWGHMIQ